jgi:hypothetical protein
LTFYLARKHDRIRVDRHDDGLAREELVQLLLERRNRLLDDEIMLGALCAPTMG